jgi:hypothetical protein
MQAGAGWAIHTHAGHTKRAKTLHQGSTAVFWNSRNIKITRSAMQMLAIPRAACSCVLLGSTVGTGYANAGKFPFNFGNDTANVSGASGL